MKQVLLLLLLLQCYWCCTHPVFCQGEILQKVQLSGIFQDSKTFVDMPLRYDVDVVVSNFKKQSVQQFVKDNFLDPETVLTTADLPDWIPQPETFDLIKDVKLREFAYALHLKWKSLAKKFSLSQLSKQSQCKANCSSILDVMDDKVFIAPGGRFRQCYYWDTYWILKGLIQGQMLQTAENIIRNLFSVINTYGFVPNGMRIYYLNRSQPPLLALMVQDLAQAYRMHFQNLKAIKLQQDALPVLIKEHIYWMTTHSRNITLQGRNHTVNFYNANTTDPRPESYKEDYLLTKNMTQSQKSKLLKNIASAAESGWDFSSRWFADSKNINTTRTTDLNPSDLNAIMALGQQYISALALSQNHTTVYAEYIKYYNNRRIYFNAIDKQGFYPDYADQHFYASSIIPLILFNKTTSYKFPEVVAPPASYEKTGQQWDFPNVWAPLVWFLHETSTYDQSLQVAQRWVDTVYCGWKKYDAMFEKYDAQRLGERGQGGEYVVQVGFGWTNGLTLELLIDHGDDLTASQQC